MDISLRGFHDSLTQHSYKKHQLKQVKSEMDKKFPSDYYVRKIQLMTQPYLKKKKF